MKTKTITAVTACAIALVGVAETAITRQQADRMFDEAARIFKSAESKYSTASKISNSADAIAKSASTMAKNAVAIYNSATADYNNAVDKFNTALDAYRMFTPTNEADRVAIKRIISKAKRAKKSAQNVGSEAQTNADPARAQAVSNRTEGVVSPQK